ncbi:hypothetical protein ACOSQ3_009754 [Xanthoceras sorbifolium]
MDSEQIAELCALLKLSYNEGSMQNVDGWFEEFFLGFFDCFLIPLFRVVRNGPRWFNASKDSAESDPPRYNDGKFGYGRWDNDLDCGRRMSSELVETPVPSPVTQKMEGTKGISCSTNNPHLLVGPNTVADVVKGMGKDKGASSSSGLPNGPDQIELVYDNLMEVKVGMMDIVEAQDYMIGSQRKVSKRWKRVIRSPSQKQFVGLPSPIKKFFTARARNRYNARSPKPKFPDKNSDENLCTDRAEGKKGKRKVGVL